MSTPLLLRAFVNERLTAAVEEIFQVFERTITQYEEDASSSKQEIERLGGLLQEFVSNHKTDISESSTCKEEISPEQLHCEQELSPNVHLRGPDTPRHIKEEAHELWAIQRPEEEFKDADVSCLPHSSAWVKNEHDVTRLPLHPQTQTSESEEQLQDEIETVHFVLPLSSQTPIHNEMVQDGRGSKRTAASFMSNQTQNDQSLSAIITSRESPHLPQLSLVAPDYRCHLCDKSFSSNHHLTNHAFRIHSKDADVLCAVCGRTLESTESLKVHLNSHRGSKCCHVCGKQCKSNTALSEHMAGHSGVKLHHCHVCGKACSRKGDLKIHMRIHTGEKPFCCSFCDKRFTHSGHLRKHLRSHTGERPHRCGVCGRGFLQSTHLKYHLRTHAR
ncbi:zinc finger protein 699-like [Pseudoliparis swirei]|uniref:zinc finger protein 699-like n=1 Tax=Pseudoliparis swirei TaxID=2059687 RepID=UPI0024BF074A|nr:zinc finger protein 699-like [Pseudoliparis swirei]